MVSFCSGSKFFLVLPLSSSLSFGSFAKTSSLGWLALAGYVNKTGSVDSVDCSSFEYLNGLNASVEKKLVSFFYTLSFLTGG